MARNERLTSPDSFSAPVPTGTLSGAPVLIFASIPAVTQTAEGAGGNIAGRASVKTNGVWDVSVPDAVSAEGTAIYITSANALTTTVGSNVKFGNTLADADGAGATKSAGAGTVHVRLSKA